MMHKDYLGVLVVFFGAALGMFFQFSFLIEAPLAYWVLGTIFGMWGGALIGASE